MFELKSGKVLSYPWFCISKVDDMVVVTTKKIASRFFEAATLNEHQIKNYNPTIHKLKTIDYRVNGLQNNFILNDINFTPIDNSDNALKVSLDEFYEELKIKNISDIFSVDYAEANKIVFVTREPVYRFYTGFIEWVDSEFGKINNGVELRNANSQEEINLVLNEYVRKVNHNIFSDSHMSLWNTFLINFLITNKIKHHVKIVDLNNPKHMQIFKKDYVFDQPSNKFYIDNWVSNPNNKKFIEELHDKFKFYFDLETDSYDKLLNVNYK